MKSIELLDVDFSYNSSFFLKNLQLEIEKAQMVGIIGPNGCGKTTLINLIRGYLAPNRGKILLFGEDIKKITRTELGKYISLVPQESKTSFNFTAYEIALMGRYPHNPFSPFESEKDRALALEALHFTNTAKFAQRYFWKLSGGEKQRVILARAIAQQAEIILLDEPTSSLDIKQALNIYDVVSKLNRTKGVTIVTATHDIELARRFCDRIIMMKNGEIFGDAPPETILRKRTIEDLYDMKL